MSDGTAALYWFVWSNLGQFRRAMRRRSSGVNDTWSQ